MDTPSGMLFWSGSNLQKLQALSMLLNFSKADEMKLLR
jgi:hypothetical protein